MFFQSHDISICTKIVLDKFVNDLVKYSELNELWNLFESACFGLNIFENCNATNKEIYILFKKITIKIYHANLRQLIKEKTEKIETKNKVPLRAGLLKIDIEAEANKHHKKIESGVSGGASGGGGGNGGL